MRQFLMPSLGADMDAGTLVEWLKQPGDRLERGDIIAVVETQKGAIEIEVFDNGILDATLVEPGAKVPVGQVLATIRSAGEPPGETLRPSRSERAVAAQLAQPPPAAPVPPSRPAFPERRVDRARVTPLARRLAHERNIDISRLAPGADGVIGRREIERALPSPRLRSAGIDGAEMRKAIASAMSRANREIPHYYVSTAIDISPLV